MKPQNASIRKQSEKKIFFKLFLELLLVALEKKNKNSKKKPHKKIKLKKNLNKIIIIKKNYKTENKKE